MSKFVNVLVMLVATYLIFSIIGFGVLLRDSDADTDGSIQSMSSSSKQAFLTIDSPKVDAKQIQAHIEELEAALKKLKAENDGLLSKAQSDVSPFRLLGAYPDVNYVYEFPTSYDKPHLGIINEDDYCDRVDLYNLAHPENMFEKKNFFSDCPRRTLPRARVMSKIGKMVMDQVHTGMPDFNERKYPLDITINNFFNNYKGVMDNYHEVGKNFLCATQMYNHIPGHYDLIRKDSILNSLDTYAKKYANKPQCFTKHQYFPTFFRLYDKTECQAFFKMLNSKEYKQSLKKEPIQYLVKIGRGSHKGQGVFLLDNEETTLLNKNYAFGGQCGVRNRSLIAQAYVTNPLLLDMQNKFDFRIYMLIASTNPLITYYHDGFLRVALNPFLKASEDKATHLTNTFLANQKIEDAKNAGKKLNGMTEEELKEYILWSFDRFQKYLMDTGVITDPEWLDNYLRPAFKKALIHIVKMTSGRFLKNSNIYELLGVDFILDDNLDLWFIESNPSPLLTGTTKHMIYYETIKDMFDVQYAYYRGRMKRLLNLIEKIREEEAQNGSVNFNNWRDEYQEAIKNRLEPEYPIRADNSFELIMDEGKPGVAAYGGLISEECILH